MLNDTAKVIQLISDTLELYGDRHGVIAPRVYTRFFELNPEAAALMEYADEYMRGRMFASVLELFLSDEHLGPGGYLAWEKDTWDQDLLTDLCDVMADASICGLGQAAPNPIRSTMKYFGNELG